MDSKAVIPFLIMTAVMIVVDVALACIIWSNMKTKKNYEERSIILIKLDDVSRKVVRICKLIDGYRDGQLEPIERLQLYNEVYKATLNYMATFMGLRSAINEAFIADDRKAVIEALDKIEEAANKIFDFEGELLSEKEVI